MSVTEKDGRTEEILVSNIGCFKFDNPLTLLNCWHIFLSRFSRVHILVNVRTGTRLQSCWGRHSFISYPCSVTDNRDNTELLLRGKEISQHLRLGTMLYIISSQHFWNILFSLNLQILSFLF